MTAPRSSLHDPDSYPHSLSPNGFDFLSISPHGESRILEYSALRNLPSMLEGSVRDSLNFIPMDTIPAQTISQTNPTPLFPWPSLQHPGDDGQGCYDYRTNQSFTSNPSQSFSGNLEQQKPTTFGMLGYGNPNGSAHSPSSFFWEDHSFESTHNITPQLHSKQYYPGRYFAHLSTGPNQQTLWEESTVTNTMNEACAAPQSRPFYGPAFDAGDSSGHSLYTMAMNRHNAIRPDVKRSYQDLSDTVTLESCETDSESTKGEPPYAKLIYNALMDAPEHRLVLRDIYAWISENTDKAKDPTFKGWQNSVRHNLSMNGAFTKVPHVDPLNKHKKGFIWVLEPSAIGKGIESTTRYRQKTTWRRNDNSDDVDPKRQRSGRKGGKAARRAANLRRSAKLDDRKSRYAQRPEDSYSESASSSPFVAYGSISPDMSLYHIGGLPYYLKSETTGAPLPNDSLYNCGRTVPSTSPPSGQTFFSNSYDNNSSTMGSEPDATLGPETMLH